MAMGQMHKKKKNRRLLKRMQRKLLVVFGGIGILFVVLICRLMYIEYTSGKRYEKIVLAQQQYDSEIIPFRRGDIVDARGTVLATSVDVYNVILDCKVLNANKEAIEDTIWAVTSSFPEVSEDSLRSQLKDNPKGQYSVLAKKVSYEEVAAFEKLKQEEAEKDKKKDRKTICGIWFEKEYVRVYPYGSLAASVIGFSSSGNTGVIGLENYYNRTLNGINGRSYGYMNTDNNMEKTVVEPENGSRHMLTLDVNIQSIVEQEILAFNQQYANEEGDGSKNTAVLVMDPDSGEILAMADYPAFDLNNPRDLSAYYTPEELSSMSEEEQMKKLNEIWQNYCVSHTFEPGSTFKPFTVAMGLETGSLTGEETYICDGVEHIGVHAVHCVERKGHGVETVGGALMDSCNDALMQMSYTIGAHNFANFQSVFGFGQKTFVDLPGEASTAGLLYDEKRLESQVNLATNSFGQNFNVTMVQLASAFCSLINGGNMYQPHIVKKVADDNGNVLEEVQPIVQKKTISREISDQMNRYLRDVVNEGSAKTAAVKGYDIGGKTGTAQKLPRGEGNYLVSFIGYAPVDDPELLVYVVVDEPNVADQAHSVFAQQIAHNIFSQVLPYLNISRITEEASQ